VKKVISGMAAAWRAQRQRRRRGGGISNSGAAGTRSWREHPVARYIVAPAAALGNQTSSAASIDIALRTLLAVSSARTSLQRRVLARANRGLARRRFAWQSRSIGGMAQMKEAKASMKAMSS